MRITRKVMVPGEVALDQGEDLDLVGAEEAVAVVAVAVVGAEVGHGVVLPLWLT